MSVLEQIYPEARTVDVEIHPIEKPKIVGIGLKESTLYEARVTMEGELMQWLMKVFDSPYCQPHYPDQFYTMHAVVASAGFPTIPEVYKDPNKWRAYYVTDLTQGGTHACLSLSDWSYYMHRRGLREGQGAFFLENGVEISDQLGHLLKKASSEGFHFGSPDVFFIVVDCSSSVGELLVGDFRYVTRRSIDTSTKQARLCEDNWKTGKAYSSMMNWYLTSSEQANPLRTPTREEITTFG